jgi:hypothetical protein
MGLEPAAWGLPLPLVPQPDATTIATRLAGTIALNELDETNRNPDALVFEPSINQSFKEMHDAESRGFFYQQAAACVFPGGCTFNRTHCHPKTQGEKARGKSPERRG